MNCKRFKYLIKIVVLGYTNYQYTIMKRMKITKIFLILTLAVSCSNRQFMLKKYASYPVKFAKQKVSHTNNDFTLYIPKNWNWKVEEYDDKNIILGIDASSQPDKDGFIDVISIQKINSFGEKKT
jgi:hypothetical protein